MNTSGAAATDAEAASWQEQENGTLFLPISEGLLAIRLVPDGEVYRAFVNEVEWYMPLPINDLDTAKLTALTWSKSLIQESASAIDGQLAALAVEGD